MRIPVTLMLVAVLAACRGENVREKPVSQSNGPSPGAAPQASAPPAPAPPTTNVTGRILETMDSGGYTYLKLSVSGSEVWAAVNQSKVTKGSTVTVVNAIPMEGFQSNTLHRKFDRILFGTLGAAGTEPAEPLPAGHPDTSDPRLGQMAAQHAAAARGPADVGDIKVSRATGSNGKTIAEIFAGRAVLKDKQVVVRGKVVKFLAGIMGRNWIHLRDGSGSAQRKDNDLTVTTAETAVVGDVVLIRGTVKTDQDFGAGYAYPVLIEGAHVSK